MCVCASVSMCEYVKIQSSVEIQCALGWSLFQNSCEMTRAPPKSVPNWLK